MPYALNAKNRFPIPSAPKWEERRNARNVVAIFTVVLIAHFMILKVITNVENLRPIVFSTKIVLISATTFLFPVPLAQQLHPQKMML